MLIDKSSKIGNQLKLSVVLNIIACLLLSQMCSFFNCFRIFNIHLPSWAFLLKPNFWPVTQLYVYFKTTIPLTVYQRGSFIKACISPVNIHTTVRLKVCRYTGSFILLLFHELFTYQLFITEAYSQFSNSNLSDVADISFSECHHSESSSQWRKFIKMTDSRFRIYKR